MLRSKLLSKFILWLVDADTIEKEARSVGCLKFYKRNPNFNTSVEQKFINYTKRLFLQKKLYKILHDNNIIIVFDYFDIKGHGSSNIIFCSEKRIRKEGCNAIIIDCLYLSFKKKFSGKILKGNNKMACERVNIAFRKFIRKYYISKLSL
jgi:hypothetical protein